MNVKNCVAVRWTYYEELPECVQTVRDYAKRINADFEIINSCEPEYCSDHYSIMQVKELLKRYNRVLVLDADIIVNENCDDLFDVIPEQKIGSINECALSRRDDRLGRLSKACEVFGHINIQDFYVNSGVMMFSRRHSDIFNRINNSVYCDYGYDDVFLSYQIQKFGYKMHFLKPEHNFMSVFTNVNRSHLDAMIIHYAGRGFYPGLKRDYQIKLDTWLLCNRKLLTNCGIFFLLKRVSWLWQVAVFYKNRLGI